VCSPSEVRVLEQLALINFLPTMNRSHVVQNAPVPGLSTHTPGITLAKDLAKYFSFASNLYMLFTTMAKRMLGYDEAFNSNVAEGVVDGSPV